MSCAFATSSATLALASKVCGSVLGFFRMADTETYLPPIWLSTLAYSFSAPIATMSWVETPAEAERVDNAVTLRPVVRSAATSAIRAGTPVLNLVIGKSVD